MLYLIILISFLASFFYNNFHAVFYVFMGFKMKIFFNIMPYPCHLKLFNKY